VSGQDEVQRSLLWRLRLGAWSMALVAVAFIQDPGRIVTDTKLDLTIDPVGFLGRTLHMWDPNGAFGQVQNQAYGYLFPMGPFFALGDMTGVPDWVTQRLWWSVILVVAFLGVVKLCGVLGIGLGWTRIVAGLAFALSPRMLSVIGPSSIEVWPSAVAPWVLIPLVIGLRRGDPWRHAAWSAVAVACVGGVNAAATFAVIPLAALWLLFAPRGPRRRSLLMWWPAFVLMGTLWWLLPLFLLGRYSPAFLDYIESASNTTFAATAFDALRGTTDWIPYVDLNADAGNRLISEPLLIVNGVVLLCFGVLGLARASLPHRRFLLSGLLLGLVLVTLGHRGAVEGFGAGTLQELLDGVLAPLRNTHKFDVLIRMPLVLGLCHALTVLTRPRSAPGGQTVRRLDPSVVGAAVLACAGLIGATTPAWSASVANRSSFADIPGYWKQAATWLEDNSQGRTLLTPATPFGDYVWGKTSDEPLQALASSPWAVRNLVPLAPGGNIEMLDAISHQFATGRGTAGFATFLRRAGISTFVVRNDLNRRQDIVPPELVRATLATTPGVHRVASFGPEVGGGPTLPDAAGRDVFVDGGWQTLRPALEVFALDNPLADMTTRPASEVPVLIGDADSLMTLDESGTTRGTDVVMAKDADRDRRYASTLLTDGNRRQEVAFGAVNHQRSGSLTRGEPYRSDRRVHRYDQAEQSPWLTVPELRGAKSISSSSSAADVGAIPYIDQSKQTWAAFDGDPTTGWEPDLADAGKISWVRVDFKDRVDVGSASITLDLPVGESRVLTVTTEQGPRKVRVEGPVPAVIDVGRMRSLVISGRSTYEKRLVVNDIRMSGVQLSRPLILPTIPAGWAAPSRILLQAGPGYDDGCAMFDGIPRCSSAYFSSGDSGRILDREITLDSAATYDLSLRVAPIGGRALTALLQQGGLTSIAASSQLTPAAEAGPLASVDGRPTTGWVAARDDVGPALSVNWVGARAVSRLRLTTSPLLAATAPDHVRLTFADGSSATAPVEDGVVRFDPVRTDSIKVQLLGGAPRYSVDFSSGVQRLPLGVSELSVPGVGGFPSTLDSAKRRFPCGTGPVVAVNGAVRKTALTASPAALAGGGEVDARICGGRATPLRAGVNRVTVMGTDAFRPVTATFSAPESSASTAPGELLVTTHNANPGWVAKEAGKTLDPVVLNGWQQGWLAPRTTGSVTTSFEPDRTYRAALVVGGLLLLALLAIALVPGRSVSASLRAGTPLKARPALLTAAGLVAAGLVAGPWGVVAGVLGAAAPYVLGRRRQEAAGWLAATSVAVAGLVYVLRPWAGLESWAGEHRAPQLLVVLAIGCLVSGAVDDRASFQRRNGLSTKR
jgi:arabinofuranan 3-O-arabinosyltransferase